MKRALSTLAATLMLATAAQADTVQATGPIVALSVNHSTADLHASYHGRILVGDSVGGYGEYRWGGSSCPGLTLPTEEVEKLQHGMNNPRILVIPRTKLGQGWFCLVGFTLVLRSELGALP